MRFRGFLAALGLALASSTSLAGPGVWTSSGPWGGRVFDLDIDPTVTTTLYATTTAGLFKTIDGGLSWERRDGDIPSGVYTPLGVLVDRDLSDTLYVFDNASRL